MVSKINKLGMKIDIDEVQLMAKITILVDLI